MRSTLTYFTVAFLFGVTLASCTVRKDILFLGIEQVKVKSVGGEVILTADAMFHNPNSYRVRVRDANTVISVDNRKVTEAKHTVSSLVPPRSDFRLPIEISIPMMELIQRDFGQIINAIWKNKTVMLRIEGSAVVEMMGIERTVPFFYEEEKGLKL